MLSDFLNNIVWLGQSGFVLNLFNKIITIDPYNSPCSIDSDIILITHPHWDHLSIIDIEKFRKEDTLIITGFNPEGKVSGNVKAIYPGEEILVDKIKIEAVPAYNIDDKSPHPKHNKWVGFIISIDGISIYHSGDTDLIPEMNNFNPDIAILPISGTYLMNVKEAIEATKIIKPKFVIPMHYDPKLSKYYKIFPGVGIMNDAKEFSRGVESFCEPILKEQFIIN